MTDTTDTTDTLVASSDPLAAEYWDVYSRTKTFRAAADELGVSHEKVRYVLYSAGYGYLVAEMKATQRTRRKLRREVRKIQARDELLRSGDRYEWDREPAKSRIDRIPTADLTRAVVDFLDWSAANDKQVGLAAYDRWRRRINPAAPASATITNRFENWPNARREAVGTQSAIRFLR